MLSSIDLPRVFLFARTPGNEPIELADPGSLFTPDRVKNLYAPNYPELTTAILERKIENDKEVFTFKPAFGTKA